MSQQLLTYGVLSATGTRAKIKINSDIRLPQQMLLWKLLSLSLSPPTASRMLLAEHE